MKRRADNKAETVAARVEAYHAQTTPLIDYYEGKGLPERIDAIGTINEVAAALAARVERLRDPV